MVPDSFLHIDRIPKGSNFKRYGKSPRLAAELELEVKNEDICRQDLYYSLASQLEIPYIYASYDCSLTYGIEIKSLPASLAWINREGKNIWKHFMNSGEFSIQRTCGLHIHIDRDIFTEQILNNFICFLYGNVEFTLRVSGRREMSLMEGNAYIRNDAPIDKKVKDAMNKEYHLYCDNCEDAEGCPDYIEGEVCAIDMDGHHKYSAVNILHPDSFEIRIFASNTSWHKFISKMEFIEALYYFSKDGNYKPEVDGFVKFVNSNGKYVDLKKYLKEI